MIARLQSQALGYAQGLSDGIIKEILGTRDLEHIMHLVEEADDGERERKLEWAHYKTLEEETMIKKGWTEKRARQI